jgi:DNA repair protein RadC
MAKSQLNQLLKNISHVCDVSAKYSTKVKVKDRPSIKNEIDIFNLMNQWYENTEMYEQREIFSVVLMTRANQVLGIVNCGEGATSQVIVDKQYIARLAILSNAQAVILCHNHPSGNLKPSEADINITKEIKSALKLFDIVLLDHLILTQDNGFTSFASQNLI